MWISVWQNGFADDVLAIDNQRIGPLPWRPFPVDKAECKLDGWKLFARTDGSAFKNQGDYVGYVNTGK